MLHKEPCVQINGVQLSVGEAMSVRVAVNAFLRELQDDDALGEDEHGRAMTQLYRMALRKITLLMIGKPNEH